MPGSSNQRRRWRDYRTATGARPIKKFMESLTDEEAAAVTAAMRDVKVYGNEVAHHLRNDIYEVIARGKQKAFRVLYATEGGRDQVLLALHAITKKTQKVPKADIDLAERRLSDWRRRGARP